MYLTPFFIWANYDIEEETVDAISLNYLATLLLDVAGLPKTEYQQYLTELHEILPVINTLGYRDQEGNWYRIDDETSPYYMIYVDRVGVLDTMDIEVELRDGYPFDQVRRLQELSKRIKSAVESSLGIAANIRLVPVGTIQRSEGKAKHVVDRRNLK